MADDYSHALDIFDAAVARAGQRPAVHYLEQTVTYAELDAMAESFAATLVVGGFQPGDRLALFLQNVPQFVVGMLAAWKAGGLCVPINPMNRTREVAAIFSNCQPAALVCLADLFEESISELDVELLPAQIFRVTREGVDIPVAKPVPASTRVPRLAREPDAPALLVYTSGTTGLPKGAVLSHRNFSFNSNAFIVAGCLNEYQPVLGIAPLFHITGTVVCFGVALRLAAPLFLMYRFEAGLALDMIERWQPRFVVAAITAFIALFNHESASRERLRCFTKVYSGGAAVPNSFVAQFEAKFGHYIHNCYGLTETASATHIVPFGERAPVSDMGGALSIGKVAPGVRARVIDEGGADVADGFAGELVIEGPMVAGGYWKNPTESAASMRPDGFRTGDIAVRDADGWFYIVDRKKDMIISSGYKVWPREVEDVLYQHPAIREVAVIGVEDAYRGESVKAFVSLKPHASTAPQELIEFCRERMAAYKYPRTVEVLPELPKTPTGKILRRALR